MKKLWLIPVSVSVLGLLTCSGVPKYNLGDSGPGGGIVFYDQGSDIGGWRYLEAAPNDIGSGWCMPTSLFQTGANGTSIGTGKANTATVVAAFGAGTYAAAACQAYAGGGYNDWFLPSKDELNRIYAVLYVTLGVGNFPNGGATYISSSQDSGGNLFWVQQIGPVPQQSFSGGPGQWRPIRAF